MARSLQAPFRPLFSFYIFHLFFKWFLKKKQTVASITMFCIVSRILDHVGSVLPVQICVVSSLTLWPVGSCTSFNHSTRERVCQLLVIDQKLSGRTVWTIVAVFTLFLSFVFLFFCRVMYRFLLLAMAPYKDFENKGCFTMLKNENSGEYLCSVSLLDA